MSMLWVNDANGNIGTVARHDRDGHPYDAMNYGYHTDAIGRKLRNRPYNIQDLADQPGNYAQDIPQMAYQPDDIVDQQDANHTINTANNFSYDALGQRTKDEKADIELIEWTASGKMKKVHHTTASGKPDITFGYDAAGNRIMKQVGDPDVDPATGYREHYVLDAQGNIMAIYRSQPEPVPNTSPQQYAASLKVVERPVYGSKRLGSYTRAMQLVGEQTITNYPYTQPMQASLKRYELTDHLGNVATVVTGRLLPMIGLGIQYQAEVVSATLHEPFGLELTGMNWQSNVSRFGFQSQIKDLELNAIHFKYREYFPSDGVFSSIDPLWAKYPWNSPYAFSENRVIDGIEFEGLEVVELNGGGTVEGPYANADQALGAALDEKGPDGAGTKSINLPDLVINGRDNMANEYTGGTTNRQPEAESPGSGREPLAHALTGLTLEGAKYGVGNTTFRLFNKKGTNFSPKLYDGWKGGSAGEIKTYGLGKTLGHVGKGLGYYGLLNSAWDVGTGSVPPLEGSMDLIMGGAGTFGGWIGGTFEVSYQAGKLIGPSKWYGDDDNKWFE